MTPVIVAGYMVRYPLAGQVIQHFQYVLGLAKMGYDVHFVESAGWEDSCFNPLDGSVSDDPEYGIGVMSALFREHGLDGRWTFVDAAGCAHGAPLEADSARLKETLLISLSGVTWLDEFSQCPTRVFIDEDPAFPQMAAASGDEDWKAILEPFNVHLTFGESIGSADCPVPMGGYKWQATRQPIVPDLWANDVPPGEAWTTVMNWKSYDNVEYHGIEYGQKDVEFRKIVDAPSRTTERLEVAVNAPDEVMRMLAEHGWKVADAEASSLTLADYRAYISGSRGELSIAKNGYVATRTGWFSDRSGAYLSSGRPVVLQDTGFSRHLPTGEGLFAFDDIAGAIDAVERCAGDLPRQSAAARGIAQEHLRYDLVLADLLRKAGVA